MGTEPPAPLLSYSPLFADQMRSAVSYVDKILKGAKPGDLPIQQPAKIWLVLSRSATQEVGLKLSDALLARADRVVD